MSLLRCITVVSYVMLGFASVLFITIGGSILIITERYKHAVTATNLPFPGHISLGTGLLLLSAGLIGFMACIKHSRCLLVLFYVLMVTILLCELAVVIVSIFYWPKVRKQISEALHDDLNMYNKDTEIKRIVDFIQSQFGCCGVENRSDWESAGFNNSYPESCCKNHRLTSSFNNKTCDYYQFGCLDYLEHEVQKYLGYVTGSGCTFFLLQFQSVLLRMLNGSLSFYPSRFYVTFNQRRK
ncbi:CD63 antigen isoform 2 [Schistosoma japonicum]|uniref:Tetraspanin n=1 Tax=Schistosoma japonicum TaxID=6182 RepID=A0A4Z2D5K4_SCHJA|nr:CD63 antigen isoform 2 [Schistosoma japonicum]